MAEVHSIVGLVMRFTGNWDETSPYSAMRVFPLVPPGAFRATPPKKGARS